MQTILKVMIVSIDVIVLLGACIYVVNLCIHYPYRGKSKLNGRDIA